MPGGTDLRFRMSMDNSNVIRGMSDVKRSIESLKGIVSVASITEIIRRTGEWAERLRDTSRELGIGVEELQALQLAADRTGMSVDKIHDFYNKIEVAATKAARSQDAFNKSFGKLGFTMGDLTGPTRLNTAELAAKVFSAKGPQSAFINLIGSRNLLAFMAFQKELDGRSPSQYGVANPSQVVPDPQVAMLGVAYEQIKEDFYSIARALAPLATMILLVVDGLMKMLNGVIRTLTGVIGDIGTIAGKLSAGDFSGAGKTFAKMTAGRLTHIGAGIGKAATFGLANKQIDQWVGNTQEQLFGVGSGLSEEEKRESEGAGSAIGTALLFGRGKTSGGVSSEFRRPGSTDWIRMEMGQKDFKGFVPSLVEKIRLNRWIKRQSDAIDSAEGLAPGQKEYLKHILNLNATRYVMGATRATGIGLSGLAAAGIGFADVEGRISGEGPLGKIPAPNRGGLQFGRGGADGTAAGNLAIGGVYGIDIQSKIVTLNEEMRNLLQQIVVNTGGDYENEGVDF